MTSLDVRRSADRCCRGLHGRSTPALRCVTGNAFCKSIGGVTKPFLFFDAPLGNVRGIRNRFGRMRRRFSPSHSHRPANRRKLPRCCVSSQALACVRRQTPTLSKRTRFWRRPTIGDADGCCTSRVDIAPRSRFVVRTLLLDGVPSIAHRPLPSLTSRASATSCSWRDGFRG